MRFPLKDWIDAHAGCRHNLGESGMHASVRQPPASRVRFDRSVLTELGLELAEELRVGPERLFLTHGATEANALITFHLTRAVSGRVPTGRVLLPEYPPLVELLDVAGARLAPSPRSADLAIVSRPRNPEGDLWSRARLFAWAKGARHLLVDETFREFTGERSLSGLGERGLWTTGTFTKFFGADHLRVGFAVAPPEEAAGFGRLVGLAVDELAPASAAGALRLLREAGRIRAEARSVHERNRAYLRRADPGSPDPAGPVYFDRRAGDGDRLAEACLRASVLVCPGRFFGDADGVRVGLTRRSFPRDLDAYLRVRDRWVDGAARAGRKGARPRRGAGGRGNVARR